MLCSAAMLASFIDASAFAKWGFGLALATICQAGCAADDGSECGDAACDGSGGTNTDTSSGDGRGPSSAAEGVADTGGSTDGGMDTAGTTDDESETGPDPDTTGDSPDCGVGEVCVEDALADWTGPGALRSGNADDDLCGADYPTQVLEVFSDLVAAPADCGCECGAASGMACGGSANITPYPLGDNVCGESPGDDWDVAEACNDTVDTPGGDSTYWIIVDQPAVADAGSCDATPTVEVSDPAYATRTLLCMSAGAGAECGEQAHCATNPVAPFEDLCVFQAGEHECPAQYPEQTIHHQEVEDARGCEACTCGDPIGACSTGEIQVYLQDGCITPSTTTMLADGTCQNDFSIGGTSGAQYIPGTHSATTCSPSDGVPTGSAEPSEPVTVCCRG